MYVHLKGLPVHRSMKEVSQLIWETCKTYLINQGNFCSCCGASLRWSSSHTSLCCFTSARRRVIIILAFSVLGMAGSYFVAWFGIRVNTLTIAHRLRVAGW